MGFQWFVQQGHCSIPLMHGAVATHGVLFGNVRWTTAFLWLWATRGGPRPLLGKRGWSVRLSVLRCLAVCPHRQSPTNLVIIPERIVEKWRPTFRFRSAIGNETSLFSTNQQNDLWGHFTDRKCHYLSCALRNKTDLDARS